MRSSAVTNVAASLFLLALVIVPCSRGNCAEAIVLAGKVVANISYPADFSSVQQRAADIDKRICTAISVEDVGSPKMKVSVAGGQAAIYVGKTLVMKAYPQDARANGVSLKELANAWSKHLATLLPLAEPSTHMGNPNCASELAREEARAAASANVSVPAPRWAIVDVVLDAFSRARALSEADFKAQLPTLTSEINGDVRLFLVNERAGHSGPTPPHKPGACPQAGGCPACRAAMDAAIAATASATTAACATGSEMTLATQRRIECGLKLVREVDGDRFKRDRVMVAYTIVKALDKETQ